MSEPVSRGRQAVVITVAGLILVVLIGGLALIGRLTSRDEAVNAKPGDCLEQTGADSVQVVDCADPDATLTVVGRVEGKTQIESQVAVSDVCAAYADRGVERTYWQGEQGKRGFVLCLARNGG